MKQRILTLITALIFALTPTSVRSDESVMDEISNQNGYSWSMSDETQITQMKGMILWGFVLAIASAVIVCLIPNSTSTGTTTTGTPTAQGGTLF